MLENFQPLQLLLQDNLRCKLLSSNGGLCLVSCVILQLRPKTNEENTEYNSCQTYYILYCAEAARANSSFTQRNEKDWGEWEGQKRVDSLGQSAERMYQKILQSGLNNEVGQTKQTQVVSTLNETISWLLLQNCAQPMLY